MAAPKNGYEGCVAAEGRQEGMSVAEESAKCSSRSFLRTGNQLRLFQNVKSVQLEETKKMES